MVGIKKISICWFRRDLRLHDQTAFYHALKSEFPVLPIFIFDTEILNKLENKKDSRVTFLYDTIGHLKKELNSLGSDLEVHYGNPINIWDMLTQKYQIQAVYTNHDYESYGAIRDEKVGKLLISKGIAFYSYKDIVIFEKNEVLNISGQPYTVFTPYKNKWLSIFKDVLESPNEFIKYIDASLLSNLYKVQNISDMITLSSIGFDRSEIPIPSASIDDDLIINFEKSRDFPSQDATSKLGVHLRFGTISVRELAIKAQLNGKYLDALIWRDFFHMILYHFPHVEHSAFRQPYDHIEWKNNEEYFEAWCNGITGYPIVDAGMRQLIATGFMHNRVRMIAGSFLTKHLLIDWRWGEAWFARHLLDFDLANNNGGWQWVAGCGTDAAPYFRIFSPQAQTLKFDPDLVYIKKWIPEYGTDLYPTPIVDHAAARSECLKIYKQALRN